MDECHGRRCSCARCSIGDVECQHSLVKLLYLRIQVLSLYLCILCKRLCLVYLCQQSRSLVLCCVIGSLGLSYRLDKSIVVGHRLASLPDGILDGLYRSLYVSLL